MQDIVIWHNPRCSKSREALHILEEKKLDIKIIKYLETPPNIKEIKDVLLMLGINAKSLMRTKEDLYKTLKIDEIDDEDTLIELMAKNPKLIERPVIIKNNIAIIARPMINIEKLFR